MPFSGTTSDVSWTFGYTPASQIATETRSNNAYAFTTSQIGTVNRNYAVNGLNQYTTAGPATFAYDDNANLTGDGSWIYTYDIENRLVKAVGGGITTNLIYDPLGRLYQTDQGTTGTTTRFLTDGDALALEYNSSNAVIDRYVHGSNAGADDPLVWYDGALLTTKHWLHADHLGSIVATTDSSGGSPTINTYDEYGINGIGNSTAERFGYTGQAFIPELGMYYYKARIYSPTLGRFLQTDPIGYEGGINIYAYAGDDPVNGTDPTGLTCQQSSDKQYTCHVDHRGDATDKQYEAMNKAYTKSVNKLMKNPNRLKTIGAVSNDGKTKMTMQVSQNAIAQSLIIAQVTYGGAAPPIGPTSFRALTNGTVGEPGGVSITMFDRAVNRPEDRVAQTFVHEGAHGTREDAALRKAWGPPDGTIFNDAHQRSFTTMAREVIEDE